jgi:hypothetical protein
VAEGPSVEKLYKKFEGEPGFVLRAIHVGEVEGMVERRMRAQGWTFPALLDTRSDVAQGYRITGHPETFLLDKRGNIVALAIGARNWDRPEIEKLIRDLIAE